MLFIMPPFQARLCVYVSQYVLFFLLSTWIELSRARERSVVHEVAFAAEGRGRDPSVLRGLGGVDCLLDSRSESVYLWLKLGSFALVKRE